MSAPALRDPHISIAFREAIDAWERGWSVIPTNRKTKKAVIPWKDYQSNAATLDELYRWKDKDSFAVVTGKVSGIIVLDIDPGGEKALLDKPLPITVTAKTPRGGYHFYYQHPGYKVKNCTHILWPGSCVDLRGDGGYVLLPDGRSRRWCFDKCPREVKLAPPPEWLLKIISSNDKTSTSKHILTCTSPIATISPVKGLNGDELARWSKDERFIQVAIKQLGIPSDNIGEGFKCILPNHTEILASASLFRMDSGYVFYRDWHCASYGEEWYSFPEVKASLAYGKAVKLSAPEKAVWQLRMLVEAGQIPTAKVPKLKVPSCCTPSVTKVYEGFLLLLGCKWLHSSNQPTTFSNRFAAAWCGVAIDTASKTTGELLKHKLIKVVGQHRGTNLFMPVV